MRSVDTVKTRDSQMNKPGMVYKIKWGDLEDDALIHRLEDTAGSEIKFGDIEKDNLLAKKLEDANDSVEDIPKELSKIFPKNLSIINDETIDLSDDVSDCKEILPLESDKPEISGNSTTSAEDFGASHDHAAKPQSIGEGESSESKERFRQRLWCFLFENLNRAVDELYLLCELECDVEQMKEANLVLEEAASDFKELKTRVEEFENVKRSSPLTDDTLVPVKMDHRRPHALSWEVRRMTTSPHRAEILSSSLEAFKKIQQERASMHAAINAKSLCSKNHHDHITGDVSKKSAEKINLILLSAKESSVKSKKNGNLDLSQGSRTREKKNSVQSGSTSEMERPNDETKKQIPLSEKEKEKEKEKRSATQWKSMDAWKEKRNWQDILSSPFRASSRLSCSPAMSRRGTGILHDKLMSPEKKKKTALDLKREAEQKHARAMKIRNELENERVQKLQKTSEKLNRVNEWQAVRSMKLREGMHARHQKSESRHEAYLNQIVRRANDESSKVNEVRFITSLNEENKKLILRQKLHDSELRRAEKLQVLKSKQKEEMAREEAVLERKKLIEADKLQRLAETQRRKEEAQVRREEERKASSAAREAKAVEQLRRKEIRARAQQEEAELLAQKLAEKLRESEQRRKFYLEQIRERAVIRDQSSPLMRRPLNNNNNKSNNNSEDCQAHNNISGSGCSAIETGHVGLQQSLKKRIKRIRQRLMALKYDFIEPAVGAENGGIGYRTTMATVRAKIGRWIQELQMHRQARKEGAASIGLISAEMVKFLDGKEAELHACRQAGLIDFIASALPASHTSKPEACLVTIYLLRLLKVVLSSLANRTYFLAQNLLPPIIPMLSGALENYIKIAASLNLAATANSLSNKTTVENFDSIAEVLDGFLWIVTNVIRHCSLDERQLQMQDGLIELIIAYQVIHRLRDLFALYDRPQIEGSPFPSSILLSINLLTVLTSRQRTVSSIDWESYPIERVLENANRGFADRPLDELYKVKKDNDLITTEKDCEKLMNGNLIACNSSTDIAIEQKNESEIGVKKPVAFLLSAISETGLVSLPSLLTAVLLQANNRLSSEPACYVLPSNFEEVATRVLKVFNNLAIMDITFMQRMLARPDLKMEFFHLMSFLLSHCTSKWRIATDQIGALLLESLLLLGYFSLLHPENQAVLRWGQSPTILHKVCDLPFVFFSDPELMPVLAGTLVAACFGSEQNKDVVQQELSTDMLLSLLRSCRNNVLRTTLNNSSQTDLPSESNQVTPYIKPARINARNSRILLGKGKIGKMRNQRDTRSTKPCEEIGLKHYQPGSEKPAAFMLHCRYPCSFIDRAEEFFSAETISVGTEV